MGKNKRKEGKSTTKMSHGLNLIPFNFLIHRLNCRCMCTSAKKLVIQHLLAKAGEYLKLQALTLKVLLSSQMKREARTASKMLVKMVQKMQMKREDDKAVECYSHSQFS